MKAIFKQLGFDEQTIVPVLAEIKRRYLDNEAKPDYLDTRDQYLKEIKSLQKAVERLDTAINNLSQPTRIAAQDALPHFTAGIQAMPKKMSVNLLTSPGQARPSQTTIVKNCFVLDVATAYRKQTGKRATAIVDYYFETKGGEFIEFLHACADELDIPTDGLTNRVAELGGDNLNGF